MAASELLQLTSRPKDSSNHWFDKNVDGDQGTDSDSERCHEELMKNIKLLNKKNKKRYKGPLRSESSQKVSEFHLKSEGDDGKVNLDDLVGSLQTSSYHSKLKKTLESMQKMGKTVDVPLEKPMAQRIQRVVAYTETAKDISKWEPTVQKNRQAEHLSFPLDPYKPVPMSTGSLATSLKPRTALEQEIASVLQSNSRMLERNNKELSQEEEEALKTMSLEEALERRKELQKLRALQSYYEQKCRRIKKIKSKKYHRIKRKAEKRAANKHTFEQLQKENPELAKIELEKAEKLRIAERMSLKHRNTSKWAKNIITKGIKDVQTRQALAEQLRISRQLTETKKAESDSDDVAEDKTENASEDTDNIHNFALVGDNTENPWLLNDGKTVVPVEEQGEEKSDERVIKLQPITAKDTKQDEESVESDGEDNSEDDEMFELFDENEMKKITKNRRKLKGKKMVEKKEEMKLQDKGKKNREKKTEGKEKRKEKGKEKRNTKRKTSEEIKGESKTKKKQKRSKMTTSAEGKEGDVVNDKVDDRALLIEHDGSDIIELEVHENEQPKKTSETIKEISKATSKDNVNLNPKRVFQIEDLGNSSMRLLDYTNDDDDGGDDDTEIHARKMTIQEAFANDDVIEEFVKEKEDTVKAGKPKDLDTSLPGWGDWGGPGVDETKRKRKFVITAKPGRPRKDTKLAHVIINEERDKRFNKNQVTSLPFPYTSHDQWERSIRTPLGKHWNTASIHHKLVKPRVTTLPGTIIEPIKPTKDIQRARVEDNTHGGEQQHGGKKRIQILGSGIKIHT